MIRGIAIAAAVMVSCSSDGTGDKSPARPPETTSAPSPKEDAAKGPTPVTHSVCATARTAIETRDFSGWSGIPASCSAGDLFDDIPTDFSDRPQRTLGTRTARWVLLELDGYYRPMASFVDGKLVMFDAMNPVLAVKAPALQSHLGAPAASEDWWYGTVKMDGGAHVYPDKGITLFINPETGEALHIALYHPTNLDGWNRNLRPRLQKKAR